MKDNKSFIIDSLRLLEKNMKLKEIKWLSESYFCELKFGITFADEIGVKYSVLKVLYLQKNKEIETKSKTGKDFYYSDEILLDGVPYIVYNNWMPDVLENYKKWLKEVLGNDYSKIGYKQ